MSAGHMAVLYSLLVLLGLSLIGPGLAGAFRPRVGLTWLIAEATDAKSHLRGLNAMMAALGMVALWACWDLENARGQVLALGLVMAVLVVTRLYSLLLDGPPGSHTLIYLGLEALLAGVFLGWPPPVRLML